MRHRPFCLTWSANGKWIYAASGDIIDAPSTQVIASLKDEVGRDVEGEKVVGVLFQDGKLVKAVDQFGVGQIARYAVGDAAGVCSRSNRTVPTKPR